MTTGFPPTKFTPPRPASKAEKRTVLAITPKTHTILKHLAKKHALSMTKMAQAIVEYHALTNEG